MTKGDTIYWKKGKQGETKKVYYISKSNSPDWYVVSDSEDDIENTYLINKRWITKSNINETKMTKEDLRTELLAGIITETQYREKCEKLTSTIIKKSLKENIAYPDVISGNATPKTDYEMAYEHYLGGTVNESDEVSEENSQPKLYPHYKLTYDRNGNIIRRDALWLDREYSLQGPNTDFADKGPELFLGKNQKLIRIPDGDAGNKLRSQTDMYENIEEDDFSETGGFNPEEYDMMDDGSLMDPETGKIVWSPISEGNF